MTYTISTRAERAAFTVEAADYPQAAAIACRRLNARRGVVAERTTGDRDKSGWFQGYRHDPRLGGLNSTGPAFHVM